MEGLLLVEALNGLTRFKECAQQLVRLNDIAFTIVFMGINDPTPAIRRDSAAIALRSTGSREFVGDDFPVFHLHLNCQRTPHRAEPRQFPQNKQR